MKPKARGIDAQLAALRTLDHATAETQLRSALASPHAVIVTAAAPIVAARRLTSLVEPLVSAFSSFASVANDPMCRARIAVAKALLELDHWDDRVFSAGLRITQIEGYDPDDTAGALRGICGLAYARMLRIDAYDAIAALLADAHHTARLAGAQAAGELGRPDAAALLRFKLLVEPDDEPEVLAACFDSLLLLDRANGVEFTARFLDGTVSPSATASHDERLIAGYAAAAELAAIALGGTRDPRALAPLQAYCERATPAIRNRVAYLALALLRSDEANATLLATIARGTKADALGAGRALATFATDPAIASAFETAVASRPAREHAELLAIFE